MTITKSRTFGAPELRFESGKLAKQADGAAVVTLGETQVLAACTTAKPREGIDFFPLTIDVEERMYAAGKIPGSFFRREGRPSETAILTARLTDRPLRPTFADGFRDEVQVVITVLSADLANAYDIPAINAASLAVMLAGLPFDGPIGAVRVGLIGGQWKVNPTYQELDLATFDMVVAGGMNDQGAVDVLMVEGEAPEGTLGPDHGGRRHRAHRGGRGRGPGGGEGIHRRAIEMQREGVLAEAGVMPARTSSRRTSTRTRPGTQWSRSPAPRLAEALVPAKSRAPGERWTR